MTGLYIHIPFCKKKCNYCDFASFPSDFTARKAYFAALFEELRGVKNKSFDTLYIGGGTPSVPETELLANLFENIEKNFGSVKNFTESTFEANPESLDNDKITLLKSCGVNRVSMGLQSANDRLLKTLGRAHDSKTFLDRYAALRRAGFDNINVDLICALPGQSAADFEEDLDSVLSLNPAHISLYSLQVEEGTPFYEQGVVSEPEAARSMLELAYEKLSSYNHYEISNFAKQGFESKHNTNYWRNGEYYGAGLGAASYLAGTRSQNTSDFKAYLAGERTVFSEKLQGKEKLGEGAMLGLRMLGGIDYTSELKENFGKEIDAALKENLLEIEKNKIKLTASGIFVANGVFSIFVPPFGE